MRDGRARGAGLARRLRRNLVVVAAMGGLAYLLLPNLVVVALSFNQPEGRYNYQWRRFSLDAWTHPCAAAGVCDSLLLSLRIAAWATLAATVLGTLTAFAVTRYRFRGKTAANALILLPMAMPEVVMGASLGTLFLNMGIEFGAPTILIAHITFGLSFVVVAVKARLAGMDPHLEEAARDLYASLPQTFLRVTLPTAAPGIGAGALLCFALSFDDFVITNFNSGAAVTFPMYVWGAAQRGIPVQVYVIGTAMFVVALLIALSSVALRPRGGRGSGGGGPL
ncbi:ABC transporter permease [Streptomyces sp. TP-A0874]|uniref:ABC transporter permease n=1 Tax=Streptomyces sp. TP-A0874 TaxID=549819 RepID=UPI00085360BC|nr:ABC transporter permease [Streptomyces sp. TP-A0874]